MLTKESIWQLRFSHQTAPLTTVAILFVVSIVALLSNAQTQQLPPNGFPGMQMRRGSLTIHYVGEHSHSGKTPGGAEPIEGTSKSRETLDAKVNFEEPNVFDPNSVYRRALPPGMPQMPNMLKYTEQNAQMPFFTSAGPGRILSIESSSTYSGQAQMDGGDFHQKSSSEGGGSDLSTFGIAFLGDNFTSIDAASKPFIVTLKVNQSSEAHPELKPSSTTTPKHTVTIPTLSREASADGSLGGFHAGSKFSAEPWIVEVTHAPNTRIYKGTARYHHRQTGDAYDPKGSSEDTITLTFTLDLFGQGG